MKLAETQIITIRNTESVIHMSIVQKQSDTGLLFNQRLFIVQQGLTFGYISKFDIKENPKNIDLKRIKTQIPIKFIKAINHDQENLVIKFVQIENNKAEHKKWVFKMASEELIVAWYQLLQQEKTRKNEKSKQKLAFSPSKKDITNQKEKQKQNPMKREQQGIRRESQNKNQKQQSVKIIDQEQEQSREFVNPLYTGYESIDSGPTQNKVVQNTKVLQPSPRSQQELEIQRKKIPVSPKRQNNHMQESFKKNEPQILQMQSYTKVVKNEKKRPLQFKADQQKMKKQSHQQIGQNYRNREINRISNNKVKSSYAEIIESIIIQSQERAIKSYKQRALEKQYEDQGENKKEFYNNVLEQFIRYQPGETLIWKNQNFKNYEDQINSKSNPELQVLQQYAINILQKQRQDKKLLKTSTPKINDFSKQVAQLLRNKRIQREGFIDENNQEEPQIIMDVKEAPFSYRYLQATSPYVSIQERQEDEIDVLHDWKAHCEQLMKRIVSEISQKKYNTKQKKNGIMNFEFDQTQVKIACSTMKTIYLNNKKSKKPIQNENYKKQQKITDYSAAKDLQVEFKNYCLLNQLLEKTQPHLTKQQLEGKNSMKSQYHSSRLKIPLTAIVEYCGFVGLFKLKFVVQEQKKHIDLRNLRQKQQKISQQINIRLNWIQNINIKDNYSNKDENQPTKTLILHINEDYYNKLHSKRARKNQKIINNKLFSVDVILEVGSLIIRDYLTKSASNGVLRKQLIQAIKSKNQYKLIKFINPLLLSDPTERSKTEAELTLLSGQILQKLSHLILKLDSLQLYYMHPSEISSFFHQSGVNIRYIGLAYDNLNQVYAKKCLMTQIAARVTKLLLRKTLQDTILQNKQQLSPNQTQNLNLQTIDFLNCVLSSSHQSITMWKLMSQHSQFYFKCELNKELIDPGYFLLSLAHHCKLIIDWKKLPSIQSVFKTQRFFNQLVVVGLRVQSKTYEPANSKMFNALKQVIGPYINEGHLNNPVPQQTFNKLTTILSLNHDPFPSSLYYLENQSPFSILSLKQLMADFIRPQSIKLSKSESNFSHLRVFNDLNQFPQKTTFHIKVSEIKWYLRLKNKEKYLKKFQQLINMMNKFYGDFCPALSEVYQIFTTFHLQNSEYEDAITFSKSSLVNTMKLCGVNHIKTGEAYYNLALCYLKANKIEDAYGLLKKAKGVYESKEKVINHTYAVINLKLGLLMLNKNEVKLALEAVNKSLETFQELQETNEDKNYSTAKSLMKNGFDYEDEVVQCFETLSRCFEVSKDKQGLKRLSVMVQQSLLDKIQSVSNLEKILRVALFPYLQSLHLEDSAQYIEIISQLIGNISSFQLTPKSYNKVVSLIKKRINQKSLIKNFENYIDNLSSITDYIQISNSLQNWCPFSQQFERQTINDFIAITEELVLFLGEGYLTGALRQSLQT